MTDYKRIREGDAFGNQPKDAINWNFRRLQTLGRFEPDEGGGYVDIHRISTPSYSISNQEITGDYYLVDQSGLVEIELPPEPIEEGAHLYIRSNSLGTLSLICDPAHTINYAGQFTVPPAQLVSEETNGEAMIHLVFSYNTWTGVDGFMFGETQGSGGAGGEATEVYVEKLAGEDINQGLCVYYDLVADRVYIADHNDTAHSVILGVTMDAALAGNIIKVATGGIIELPHTVTGSMLFLGAGGVVTSTVPTTGFMANIGDVTGSNRMKVEVQPSIILL